MAHPFAILQKLGLNCTGVLQIGASNGQEVQSVHDSGAKVAVFVEPLLQPYQLLAEKTRRHRGMIAVRALCAETSGREVALHVASNGGMSSSILPPTGHREVHPNIAFTKVEGFRTITVDDLMATLAQKTKTQLESINTMILDVQGAEPAVLAGSSRTLAQIDHVFCEVSLGGLYEGDLPMEDMQAILRAKGYRLCWLGLNRKGWGDALFIRESLFEGHRAG